MSDALWTVVIIAGVVVFVLVMFRKDLRRFFIRAGKGGIEAELETRDTPEGEAGPGPEQPRAGVRISGVKQVGSGSTVEVGRTDVEVSDISQVGRQQSIVVKADPAPIPAALEMEPPAAPAQSPELPAPEPPKPELPATTAPEADNR